MCRSEVRARVVLRNAKVPDAIGHVVFHARRFVRTAVLEIGIEQMAGAATDVEFTRARLQRDVHGFGALPIHGARLMLQIARVATIPRKRAAMPEKNNQHQTESKLPERRAQRNSCARIYWILKPL